MKKVKCLEAKFPLKERDLPFLGSLIRPIFRVTQYRLELSYTAIITFTFQRTIALARDTAISGADSPDRLSVAGNRQHERFLAETPGTYYQN